MAIKKCERQRWRPWSRSLAGKRPLLVPTIWEGGVRGNKFLHKQFGRETDPLTKFLYVSSIPESVRLQLVTAQELFSSAKNLYMYCGELKLALYRENSNALRVELDFIKLF